MIQDSPTVFIIDDDPGVRESLSELMNSVHLDTETFASAADFLDAYTPTTPGCILLDVRMPEMSGLELQKRLIALASTLPIIFLTAHGDVPTAVQAVQAGAIDFIEKPFQSQALIDKVQQALGDNARRRAELADHDSTAGRLASLTQREREVLETMLDGKGTAAAAEELGISRRTVEIHRANVMRKMQADSVVMLVHVVGRHRE